MILTKYIYNINNNIKSIYSNNILDSSLITATKNYKIYNTKVVFLDNIIHVYFYHDNKKKLVDNEFNDNFNKIINDIFINKFACNSSPKNTSNNSNNNLNNNLNVINIKNINRSKINCQLLAKANISSWHTFITLTYSNNFIDINISRKHLKYFIDKVRRVYKDFKYICITEFQKRGAIHYHLLTNIDISNTNLLYIQENTNFYHIKYWNYGFNSVEFIYGNYQKIIGYISKYMTKDIDNRLFNYRRYLYSQNLNRPIINYLDLSNKKECDKLFQKLSSIENIYSSEYKDLITNNFINFYEFILSP